MDFSDVFNSDDVTFRCHLMILGSSFLVSYNSEIV